MAARAAPAVTERRSHRGRRERRPTLFRRLFLTYAAVVGAAVAVLVLAPITVSVPTALPELAVILTGFVITLLVFRAFLQRALAPLDALTQVMREVDPLAPGQRIEVATGDEEVVALAEAFNEMLDRLEGERRESGRRALAAQEAERRRIARELHDEIGQLLTGLILRGETLARRAPEEVRADVVGLREGAREAAEEVRLIARRLRPEALDELGLQSALLALCTTVAERVLSPTTVQWAATPESCTVWLPAARDGSSTLSARPISSDSTPSSRTLRITSRSGPESSVTVTRRARAWRTTLVKLSWATR